MVEETEAIRRQVGKAGGPALADSSVGGVSVRAWLAVILVVTVCFSHIMIVGCSIINAVQTKDLAMMGTMTTIGEPLYSMSVAALGFYFGQKSSTASQNASTQPDKKITP